jgi:hypothetical protein
MNREKSTATPQPQDLAVFDGRDCVGFIRELTDIWAAYDASGKYCGRFASQTEAMRAIPTTSCNVAPARTTPQRPGRARIPLAAATEPRRQRQ